MKGHFGRFARRAYQRSTQFTQRLRAPVSALAVPALSAAMLNLSLPPPHDLDGATPRNAFGTGKVNDSETAETYEKMFEEEFKRDDLRKVDEIAKVACWDRGLSQSDEPAIVCDVGAGTGAYMSALSHEMGDNGVVLALDITPAFVAMLSKKSKKYSNVIAGQNTADSLCLSDSLKGKVSSVVLGFVYHHLDNRDEVMQEIYSYLKPGGKVIIVEFDSENKHRPGQSLCSVDQHDHSRKPRKEKTLESVADHIHFTKKDCIDLVSCQGFNFSEEICPGQLAFMYALVFQKPKF